MHWSRIAVLAASCVLLWGCTEAPRPSTPPPSPVAPTPTFSCTPEAGGAAYECSQFDYEQMVAKDKLYAEAEAVYRKFFAEDERIYRAGGVDEPTPVLLETTTGKFLEDSMRIYRALKKFDTRAVGGEFAIKWIRRVPGKTLNNSELAMQTCIDSSSVTLVEPGEKNTNAGFGSDLVYFARVNGTLKLSDADGDMVNSC